jgi:hypothetical protein
MSVLRLTPIFVGVTGVIVAAVACILVTSSGKLVGNVKKQDGVLHVEIKRCKVRGTRWPSGNAASARQFPWKHSIQEDPKCGAEHAGALRLAGINAIRSLLF